MRALAAGRDGGEGGYLMALDLNEKPWYVALILGVVLGVAFYVVMQMYYFKPIEEEIVKVENNIEQLEREIEKGLAAKADLPKLEEDIRNLELDLDRLRKILPTRTETDALLKRLKQLTERGRFSLTQFVPGDFQDRDFYIEWPIKVSLLGTYHELALFFDQLSRFKRIINVTELKIVPMRSKGGDGFTIRADFTQRTFIYKDETPPSGSGGTP
jgi:type IV pilus assembly protein PilO